MDALIVYFVSLGVWTMKNHKLVGTLLLATLVVLFSVPGDGLCQGGCDPPIPGCSLRYLDTYDNIWTLVKTEPVVCNVFFCMGKREYWEASYKGFMFCTSDLNPPFVVNKRYLKILTYCNHCSGGVDDVDYDYAYCTWGYLCVGPGVQQLWP